MQSERIARLLPEIFQRTLQAEPNVLGAFLDVMENLHAPSEAVLDQLDEYMDARLTLDKWLPFLATWVDLDRFLDENNAFPGGPARLRALILAAIRLSKDRGTRQGLIAFLETATGLGGFQVQDAHNRPYHIIVSAPPPDSSFPEMGLEDYRDWLNDLIRSEKPAYVTCELRIQSTGERSGPVDTEGSEKRA